MIKTHWCNLLHPSPSHQKPLRILRSTAKRGQGGTRRAGRPASGRVAGPTEGVKMGVMVGGGKNARRKEGILDGILSGVLK